MQAELDRDYSISDAEWDVMRIVWTLGTVYTNQVVSQLQAKKDWSESTIKTLMRRLEKKGFLKVNRSGHRFTYEATISQDEMMYQSIKRSLAAMCDMHKGQLLLRLLDESPMSKNDLAKVAAKVAEKQLTAPDQVPCNCLAHDPDHCADNC